MRARTQHGDTIQGLRLTALTLQLADNEVFPT